MNTVIIPWFHALAVMVLMWWFLLRLAAWRRGPQVDGRVTLAAAVAAVALCLAPVGGVPWMRWVFGVWTNPSLPLLGWAVPGIARLGFGREILAGSERRSLAWFGAVSGTILYLHFAVPGAPDLYASGWESKITLGALAAAAMLFLGLGNRVGLLFLLALIAHAAGALESTNAWDYVVDPVYWMVGVGVLVSSAVKRTRKEEAELGVKN
jgi:hypothetical protein